MDDNRAFSHSCTYSNLISVCLSLRNARELFTQEHWRQGWLRWKDCRENPQTSYSFSSLCWTHQSKAHHNFTVCSRSARQTVLNSLISLFRSCCFQSHPYWFIVSVVCHSDSSGGANFWGCIYKSGILKVNVVNKCMVTDVASPSLSTGVIRAVAVHMSTSWTHSC